MKKIFFLALVIPTVSFAAPDVSDCEKIAHRISSNTVEKCTTPPQICAEEPNSNKCLMNTKTVDECTQLIAKESEQLSANNYILRCPMTPERISWYEHTPETSRSSTDWVYEDGSKLNFEDLINDKSHAYLVKIEDGFTSFFDKASPDKWYIITPQNSDGFYMANIK